MRHVFYYTGRCTQALDANFIERVCGLLLVDELGSICPNDDQRV